MSNEHDWLSKCVKEIDVTDVGEKYYSLLDTVCGKGSIVKDILEEKDEIDLLNNVLSLRSSLKQLKEKELEILDKRYYQDMTQTEIANELGISQAQVSRLEKSAISTLRKEMGEL